MFQNFAKLNKQIKKITIKIEIERKKNLNAEQNWNWSRNWIENREMRIESKTRQDKLVLKASTKFVTNYQRSDYT